MKGRKIKKLLGFGLVVIVVLLLIIGCIPTVSAKAKYYKHCTEEPEGADIWFSIQNLSKPVDVCSTWEYGPGRAIFIENRGNTAGVITKKVSCSGNPDEIDFWVREEIGPNTQMSQGGFRSFFGNGTFTGFINNTNEEDYHVFRISTSENLDPYATEQTSNTDSIITVLSSESYVTIKINMDHSNRRITYVLQDAEGEFFVNITSIYDETVRHLTNPGEYIIYNFNGKLVDKGMVQFGGTEEQVNKFELLIPSIISTLVILFALVATVVYFRHRKK